MLSREGCAIRQHRLLEAIQREKWDLFVTSNHRTVYYLTGSLSSGESPVILALWSDGTSTLITSDTKEALVDEVVPLELYSILRSVSMPVHDAVVLFRDRMSRPKSVVVCCAVERGATNALVEDIIRTRFSNVTICDATPTVLALRKKKEDDEIDEIRASLRLCAAAYRAARAVITPHITEIDVFNAMQAAVNREAGVGVPLLGDFACGTRAIRGGGAATDRPLAAGELFPLDLFPAWNLYFGDTCRTFCIGEPTDRQHRAWKAVSEALVLGEKAIRPGVAASAVYSMIKEYLDSCEVTENSFWHHAGHGVGHHGHEAPRIIPGSDDIFAAGDVITLEPGVYTSGLNGGIRIENNYVVREHGLENLFVFPQEL